MSKDSRISFIDMTTSDGKRTDVYVGLFPVHLRPHRSTTKLEALRGLKSEVISLLSDIDREERNLNNGKCDGFVTEIDIKSNTIKQKPVTIIGYGDKWKVYGYWGYKHDQALIVKDIGSWHKSGGGFSNILRKVSVDMPTNEAVIRETALYVKKRVKSSVGQCKLIV